MAEIGLYDAMSSCRAVRRLKADPIPDAVLRRVLQAAAWAPTGGNAQPWRAIAVRERAAVARLGELYHQVWSGYSAQSRKNLAPLEPERRAPAERMLAAGDYLAENFARTPVVVVFCFNPDQMAITDARLGRPSVVGGASLYPAVQNLLLACRAEGLGCVLTTLLCAVEPQVRELLEIPQPWATGAHVPIGWPERRGHGPLSRRPLERLVFGDRFGAPLQLAR
jgi:nitroreductase